MNKLNKILLVFAIITCAIAFSLDFYADKLKLESQEYAKTIQEMEIAVEKAKADEKAITEEYNKNLQKYELAKKTLAENEKKLAEIKKQIEINKK